MKKHIDKTKASLKFNMGSIGVYFYNIRNEPLVIDIDNGNVDGFFKWNGESIAEINWIFNMFSSLQPYFELLQIDDDEGYWYTFEAQKKSGKIKLLSLPPEGKTLLTRIHENELNGFTTVEEFVKKKTELHPPHQALLHIIIQDFLKIMKIECIEDFCPSDIINLIQKINYLNLEKDTRLCLDGFDFYFRTFLLEIWFGYMFYYKNIGILKDLPATTKGAKTSKIAALYGIRSIFLNCHAGGPNNAKEAEMRLFAKKYYPERRHGEVMVIDSPEQELVMLFSMLTYLGLRYRTL